MNFDFTEKNMSIDGASAGTLVSVIRVRPEITKKKKHMDDLKKIRKVT